MLSRRFSYLNSDNRAGRTDAKQRRDTDDSCPRSTPKEIKRGRYRNLAPGSAMDLTVNDPDDGQPWDFNLRSKRDKARRILREQKPVLLIGSPMCTHFSTWQYLNYSRSKDQAAMRRARAGACVHLEFVAELYHEQIEG